MKSHTTPDFRSAFAGLPKTIQQQARDGYNLFKQNPQHPSLHFKHIHASQQIVYSVRVGLRHRALAYEEHGELYWFWIGTHEHYNNLVKHI